MIYLLVIRIILSCAYIAKWWHDAYWIGKTWNIEIPTDPPNPIADSYVEFIREVTEALEQNDNLQG